MTAPFEYFSPETQTAVFLASLTTLVVFATLMRQNAKTLKNRGAGIVALQRAGSPAKAHSIMLAWDEEGRRAAGRDLRLDTGLIAGYSVGLSVLFSSVVPGVENVAGQWWAGTARTVGWLPLIAGAVDFIENVALSRILTRYRADPDDLGGWPMTVHKLSVTKFLILGVCLGWAALVLWPLLVP